MAESKINNPTTRQKRQRAHHLRKCGLTWEQIAAVWESDHPGINPRVAFRWAHGLSHQEVAEQWNSLDPGQPTMTKSRIYEFEAWPKKGRRPNAVTLQRLAQIYQTVAQRLLTDRERSQYSEAESAEIARVDHRSLDQNHSAGENALVESADSAENMTFGESMHTLLKERGISLRKLAQSIPANVGYLSKISHDLKSPSEYMAKRIDNALDAGGTLAALRKPAGRQPYLHSGNPVGDKPFDEDSASNIDPFATEWNEMERRLFLQLATSVGLGSITGISFGKEHAKLLEVVAGSEPRDIDDWELACTDHLYALRTRPPEIASRDLLVDLSALQLQLQNPQNVSSDLQRVLAALSTLHANLLTRRGEHGAAIRWWRTARQAADASGDLELRLGIRGTEAGHGLFGQRSPETVLALTQRAQQIAGNRPSLGLTLVLCSQAKALSALGRNGEARKVLSDYRNVAAVASPASGGIMPGYWGGDQEVQLKLYAAESQVAAQSGDESATDRAIEQTMRSANGDYQIIPSLKLHEAMCVVRSGGIDVGVNQASAVFDVLPFYPAAMTVELGRRVLRAVPVDALNRPAVREFGQILKTAAAPRELSQ